MFSTGTVASKASSLHNTLSTGTDTFVFVFTM